MTLEDTSISDDIRAAIAETNGAPEVTEPVAADAPEPSQDPVEGKEPANRDDKGKFVAKQAEPAQDTTEQPKTVETPQESIRPPASWSAQAKADFAALPPHIQKEVSKREGDIDKGFRERAEQLKRYEPLEQLLAPRRDLWAAAGSDEVSAVRSLLAAQDLLDKNPVQGLQFLARSYGVDIASLGQPSLAQPNGGAGQPQAQPDPVANEIQVLRQELQALKQGKEQEVQQTYTSQIEAFAANPENLYFENVKPAMAKLLTAGLASDLSDAYQQAIWADPTIRPLLQQQTAKPVTDPNRAVRAKLAGASVTGSPGNAPPPTSNGSISDDIRAAMSEVQGRA